VTAWEYLIVALPPFKTATAAQGQSDSVTMLNREGGEGWEGIGMTMLQDGHVAVLMKRRPLAEPATRSEG
jgi:hypothetical protein